MFVFPRVLKVTKVLLVLLVMMEREVTLVVQEAQDPLDPQGLRDLEESLESPALMENLEQRGKLVLQVGVASPVLPETMGWMELLDVQEIRDHLVLKDATDDREGRA